MVLGYSGAMTPPRWLDDQEQRAWRTYIRLHGQLRTELNRQLQNDSDLSLSDFEVLVYLSESTSGRLRVQELARTLQWEQSRLSHQVARMQRRGLVTREECSEDGRGSYVALTTAGRDTIETAAPPHVETVRRLFFDALTPSHVETLTEISERVLARLDPEET
jgi:DNA-binding MarR family transcriptional regulator